MSNTIVNESPVVMTQEEKEVLGLLRIRKLFAEKNFRWTKTVGKFELRIRWDSSKNLCGRFGGGWNWELGIQIGGSTVLFNLLVLSVSISKK